MLQTGPAARGDWAADPARSEPVMLCGNAAGKGSSLVSISELGM